VTVIEHGVHPQRLDLTVHAGDEIDESIPLLDGLGAEVSLAGWSVAARAEHVDGQVLYDFAPTIESNEIRVVATSAQTGAWTWPVYAARLVVTATPPSGAARTYAAGWIRFYPR
jgi:hypothetical protein